MPAAVTGPGATGAATTPTRVGRVTFPASIVAFIKYVSQKTGLRPEVVAAWVLAEGGKPLNPLNIRNPQTHRFDPFRSTQAAAEATVRVINQPNMAVIKNSGGKSIDAQLHAIAASPWDTPSGNSPGHYGGDGRNLRGAYSRVTGVPNLRTATPQGDPFQSADTSVSDTAHALNPATWIGQLTDWAAKEGTLALLYLTFSALAIAFLVLGGLRAAGQSPATLAKRMMPAEAAL